MNDLATDWRPTDEQFAAFLVREHELCMIALRKSAKVGHKLLHHETLFSRDVWEKACTSFGRTP